MGKLFGTDGVRGVANEELTCELAFKIGRCAAFVLTGEIKRKPEFLIGKDTRISGDMLEAALTAGLCSVGAKVISLGVIPTPAVAYLTRKYNADAGIVISASHNSAEYNGIKIFNGNGYKLNDEIEERIEELILNGEEGIKLPTGDAVGTASKVDTAVKDYVKFAKKTIDCDLSGMKIAVDCANGASCETAVNVLVDLGAEVFVIANHPNGTNINLDCGSTHTDKFCEYVKNVGVDIGLSFDGDADRLLAVDASGKLVDGDELMAISAKFLKEHGIRTRVKKKISEGSEEILDSMRKGYVNYVISTRDVDAIDQETDGSIIRRCAVENNIAMFTALDTVRVLLDVLEEITLCISTIDE